MNEESGTRDRGSWASCLGCLVGGLLVLGLAIGAGWYFYGRSGAVDARIEETIIASWAAAVREDAMAHAWSELTTEAYRERSPQEDVVRTYRTMVERWGPPREVSVISANGAHDTTTGRSYTLTYTSWVFANGTRLVVTFELVEAEDGTYRVDRASPGGRRSIPPRDLPRGPF